MADPYRTAPEQRLYWVTLRIPTGLQKPYEQLIHTAGVMARDAIDAVLKVAADRGTYEVIEVHETGFNRSEER